MKVQYNSELQPSARPGLGWALIMVMTLGFAVSLGLGCKKVPVLVKLDTPEAAASTLVQLYAAEQLDGLEQVVDPALLPIEVRGKACSSAISRSYRCFEERMRVRLEGGSLSQACEAAVSPRNCTCGETGAKAVAAAGGYLSTNVHGVLRDAHLDADKCKVTKTQGIDKAGVSKVVSFFSESLCEDVSASDSYTSAEIKCGDDPPIAFVLRESDAKWRLFAIEEKTVARWALSRHE